MSVGHNIQKVSVVEWSISENNTQSHYLEDALWRWSPLDELMGKSLLAIAL